MANQVINQNPCNAFFTYNESYCRYVEIDAGGVNAAIRNSEHFKDHIALGTVTNYRANHAITLHGCRPKDLEGSSIKYYVSTKEAVPDRFFDWMHDRQQDLIPALNHIESLCFLILLREMKGEYNKSLPEFYEEHDAIPVDKLPIEARLSEVGVRCLESLGDLGKVRSLAKLPTRQAQSRDTSAMRRTITAADELFDKLSPLEKEGHAIGHKRTMKVLRIFKERWENV